MSTRSQKILLIIHSIGKMRLKKGTTFFVIFGKKNGKTQGVPWITLVFSRDQYINRSPLFKPELISNDLVLPLTMVMNNSVYLENRPIALLYS